MQKYSKIIVLSRGVTIDPQSARTFENGKDSFSYAIPGDPYEFVFKALAKLQRGGACQEFVLVGGEAETIENRKRIPFKGSDGNTIPKAVVAKQRLIQEYGIPAEMLTTLQSSSNTQGNTTEVFRYLLEEKIEDTSSIGLLTNFFHLPRAMKMFHREHLSLDPISAESVIYDDAFDALKSFYEEQGFLKILGEMKESDSEIKGMGDYENGSYSSRFG